MSVLSLLWSLLLVVLLLWIPGTALGLAAGMRWTPALATAPLLSIGLLTVVGVWSGLVGAPWGPLSVTVAVAAVVSATWAVRLLVRRRRPVREPAAEGVSPRAVAVVLAGLGIAATVGTLTWWRATEGLTLVNQDWDIPWHANMVRLIAESGTWSTSVAGNFAYYDTGLDDAPIRSYPIALHAVLALVWPATGVSIPLLLAVFQLVVIGFVVPIGTAALTWRLGRSPLAAAAAAVASVCLSSFPYDMLFRGPLLPLVVGMALVPAFVVLALRASGRGSGPATAVLAGVGAVGILGAHASVAVLTVVVAGAWVVLASPFTWDGARRRLVRLAPAAVTAAVLGAPLALELYRESGRVSEVDWPAYETVPQAVGEVAFFSHGNPQAQWVWALLVVVGVVVGMRRPSVRWYVAAYAGAVLVAAWTAGSDGELVTRLTGFVYNDSWRLVGFATLLAIPLVGLGAQTMTDLVRSRGVPARGNATLWRAACASVAAVVLVLVLTGDVHRNVWSLQRQYRDGPTLTSSEIALLQRVGDHVPVGAQVLNDACDGSVWMYALGDRMPMVRHFEIIPTDRQLLLLNEFNRFDSDPEVRAAAADLGIEYVYVSDGRVRSYLPRPPGLEGLEDVRALTLVDREGGARLYRIDWDDVAGGRQLLEEAARDHVTHPGVPGIWETQDPAPLEDQNAVCV